jgi:hypothetical protein
MEADQSRTRDTDPTFTAAPALRQHRHRKSVLVRKRPSTNCRYRTSGTCILNLPSSGEFCTEEDKLHSEIGPAFARTSAPVAIFSEPQTQFRPVDCALRLLLGPALNTLRPRRMIHTGERREQSVTERHCTRWLVMCGGSGRALVNWGWGQQTNIVIADEHNSCYCVQCRGVVPRWKVRQAQRCMESFSLRQ